VQAGRNGDGGQAVTESAFDGLDHVGGPETVANFRFAEVRGVGRVFHARHSGWIDFTKWQNPGEQASQAFPRRETGEDIGSMKKFSQLTGIGKVRRIIAILLSPASTTLEIQQAVGFANCGFSNCYW
jgi:hypothetical protein